MQNPPCLSKNDIPPVGLQLQPPGLGNESHEWCPLSRRRGRDLPPSCRSHGQKINGAEAGINRPDKDSEHFDVVGYLSRGHKKLGPASKALRWLALILFLAIMAVTIFGGLTVIVASMVYGPACKYPGVGAGDAGE
mmetsp:Transcript_59038/g.156699  ORF Transcript_59038/g.156699 Transcript_59038/m.156699 type:complete len:136 (-) Transcript_59038:286-693(-)